MSIKSRMMECSSRRAYGCGRIDLALGWQHSMTMQECDECWALAAESPEAWAYRNRYVQLTVGKVKAAGLDKHGADVRQAVLKLHALPDEIEKLKAQALMPKPPCLSRWAGRTWRGVAWPKRPFIALWAGVKAIRARWKALKTTGCGCDDKLKRAVTGK